MDKELEREVERALDLGRAVQEPPQDLLLAQRLGLLVLLLLAGLVGALLLLMIGQLD